MVLYNTMATRNPARQKQRKQSRYYRLQSYLSVAERVLVERALKLLGRGVSISGFAADAVLKEAKAVIASHEPSRPAAQGSHAQPLPRQGTRADSILALRGIGKTTFAELGGGEAFLKAERASWSEREKKLDRAWDEGR